MDSVTSLDAFKIGRGTAEVGAYSDNDRVSICGEIYERLSRGMPISHDLSFASLVRPSDKDEPVQRWFQYREGYTVELCKRVISKDERFIVDPFCGFGTTLLAARAQNIPSLGVDVNPLAVFVSTVKSRTYSKPCIDELAQQIDRIRLIRSSQRQDGSPLLRIIDKLFHPEILRALLIFRSHIDSVKKPRVREFLRLGWLAILERVSNVYREGNGVKYRNRIRRGNEYSVLPYDQWQEGQFPKDKFRYVKGMLADHLSMMLADAVANTPGAQPSIVHADAAALVPLVPKEGASLALFSPPYCNCFNYIKAYKVELWMGGFIQSYPDIRALTSMGIRSRVESLNDPVREPYPPIIDSLVSLMDEKKLWSRQLPDVVRGYFADMRRCLERIHQGLSKKGRCIVVVGNSAYAGVLIPTDLLLAHIAQTVGFEVEDLVVSRHLTTSSQQRTRLAPLKTYLRETIIHLRKAR